MDCLMTLFNYTGQKLDDVISSVVLYVPFGSNRNDVTPRPMTSQQRQCPVAMGTNNITNQNEEVIITTSGKRKSHDDVDSDFYSKKLKMVTLETHEKLKRNSELCRFHGKTAIPLDLLIEKDYRSKYGLIALKINPEDVKVAKELSNLHQQNVKKTNEMKSMVAARKLSSVAKPQRQLQLTGKSIENSDVKNSQLPSSSFWTSIMAPLDVIVHMLPSSVFGESRNSHQVSAVYSGNFLDRLIKSLPISPFGGISGPRLAVEGERRTVSKYQHSVKSRNVQGAIKTVPRNFNVTPIEELDKNGRRTSDNELKPRNYDESYRDSTKERFVSRN